MVNGRASHPGAARIRLSGSGALPIEAMGTVIAARSADQALLDRLRAGSLQARVHSVFPRTINLCCASDGALYALAVRGADNAPGTMVVDLASFAGTAVRPGAVARGSAERLVVGPDVAVAVGCAEPWSAVLPVLGLGRVPLTVLQDVLARHGVAGGISALAAPGDAMANATARRLGEATDGLCRALADGDLRRVHEYGGRLVGLGPGLTPSGDDFLVGIATACALRGAHEGLSVLRTVVEENAPRTNRISSATMAHAVRGRVCESIVALAQALVEGDAALTRARAQRVIGIGATSGTDIVAGLLAGLALD